MFNKTKSLLNNRYFISFLLGSFSALSFAPIYFIPSAIIAFSGLFLLSKDCKNNKESFWIGYLFGFGQFIFGLYWISISLFVDISKFFWLLPFALFLIPAVLAIYIGLTLLTTNYLAKKFNISNWRKIILLAVIWVFFEYLRGILFTGFPWNLLGYSFLFSTALSQTASVIGVLGLSLIAVVFYSSPALFLQIKNRKIKFYLDKKSKPFLVSISVLIVLMAISGISRINNFKDEYLPSATFRLVQPAIKQSDKWDARSQYESFLESIRLSHKEGFEDVNYVIWSESAVPYLIDPKTSFGLIAKIASASPPKGFIITGALRAESEVESKENSKEITKLWNSIFVINSDEKIIENYDKNHLVPFGEYIPFSDFLPFISKITNGSINFSEGSGLKTITLNSETPSFSPLVCYEAIFSGNVIDRNNPPEFLLNLTNDAWFGSSSGPYQHFDMVKMRSIEYGLPTIRVANNGISGIINPIGKVPALIPLNQKGILDVMLMKNLPSTIYGKFGNKIIFWIGLILFAFALFGTTKKYSV
ncbi:MAG: apolipoprotein N-acyltransferase [Rickettsiales bacterium]|jgi:apolipoprotein N-acyltransferase